MPNENTRQSLLEICWWAFTAVLTSLILLLIDSKTKDFPFYLYNGVSIVVAITLTRYIFTLHFSWLKKQFLLQGVLSFLMIFIVFFIGQGLNEYTTYMDNNGPDILVRHLPVAERLTIKSYLDSEYFLFGVWAIVAGVVFPFRMMHNLWQHYRQQR